MVFRYPRKPRVGVFKLASCDGCQLTLLNCAEELLLGDRALELVHFQEASSSINEAGPFDICLIEGSVSTEEQRQLVHRLRERSEVLVALGTCAIFGGVQALRTADNFVSFIETVYRDTSVVQSLDRPSPIKEHISVDYELSGCPINAEQLTKMVTALVVGRKPSIQRDSVCLECKKQNIVCLSVFQGVPCLGPVTISGCGALCPSFGRGCFGCFGPRPEVTPEALARHLVSQGVPREEILRRYRLFSGSTSEE